MTPFILIETSDLSNPDLVDLQETFFKVNKEFVGVTLSQTKANKAVLGFEEYISLSIILEPIVKYGIEFLIKEMFEWIKKKFEKEDKGTIKYVFNIYASENSAVFVTSEINKAQRKINQLTDGLVAVRTGVKGDLFSLLGKGEIEKVLTSLVENDKSILGANWNEIKAKAVSMLNEIQQYKSNHQIENNDQFDIDFKISINQKVFELITLLSDDN